MIVRSKDPSLHSYLLQRSLQDLGYYAGALDNWWGPRSEAAYQKFLGSFLIGDGSWAWTARIDGNDIVLDDVTASWFGGDNDPLDNGETASGVFTKGHPDLFGCALAVIPGVHSTAGSPLVFNRQSGLDPSMHWQSPVIVSCGTRTVIAPLIDNGPAKWAKDAIDLTTAAFKALGGQPGPIDILSHVNIRIPGAASYVSRT